MNVYFINKSTVISDEEISTWMDPFQKFVKDVHRWWPRDVHLLQVKKGEEEPTLAWKIVIADTSDEAGALGYHDFTPDSRPISYVFAKDDQEYGYNPTVTATHELAEMIADPWISQVFQISDTQFFAQEICDPCEADEQGYVIDGIIVSDFVTPRWFVPGTASGYIFDQRQRIHTPLDILPGGYMSIYEDGHGWSQIYADKDTKQVRYAKPDPKNKGRFGRLTKYGRQYHTLFVVNE